MEKRNELIAQFMGYPECDRCKNPYCDKWHQFVHYHQKWDWLMPVVEKISRLRIGDGKTYVDYAYPRTFAMLNDDGSDYMMVRLNGFGLHQSLSLLEATYEAVVEFIQHYNEMDKSSSEPKNEMAVVHQDAIDFSLKYHPAPERLSLSAQKIMGRNAYQVLGMDLQTPSDFIVCWRAKSGGTDQAIRIAESHGIKVCNLFGKKTADFVNWYESNDFNFLM